jgi:16S rRNA G966 N2-methylase RsmD
MRIIAGQSRRRSLQSRPGLDLRPTSDRLETLFDVLAAVGSLSDSVWVDLHAGTGAVGIEALSRGARVSVRPGFQLPTNSTDLTVKAR